MKAAEIGGSNAVNYLDSNQLAKQNLQHGSKRQQAQAVGARGSNGITDSIHHYRDNDITSGQVNAKLTGNRNDGRRADHKPKPKVAAWEQPKGHYTKDNLTLQ